MSNFFKRCLFVIPLLLSMGIVRADVASGDTPPDFLGKTRTGDEVTLGGLHGKVVVVAFWASWCKYCRHELPTLAGIQYLAGTPRLQVVAVNTDDDRETFIKLSRALARETPGIIYTFDRGPISKGYGATTIPHTVLIDQDGKVAYVHVGYDDGTLDDLAKEVTALLARQARPAASPGS